MDIKNVILMLLVSLMKLYNVYSLDLYENHNFKPNLRLNLLTFLDLFFYTLYRPLALFFELSFRLS
jgi:hypothetical protein